jgi:ABC-2 type transport system permease protein
MAANLELQRVNEWQVLRGFSNLLRKENRAWWGTTRWWINAFLWAIGLGGIAGFLLFVLPTVPAAQTTEDVVAAGGPVAYAIQLGISVFFRIGSLALALGAIVLSQDLILDEKNAGVTEWLLAKPVARRAYILAKLAASALAMLVLLVLLPALVMYLLLSLRTGAAYALVPFLKGTGILAVHTLFYLTLTLMLGTIFNNRTPILGIALGSVMGGTLIGGVIKPLLYITPWVLGSSTELVVMGRDVVPELVTYPLVSTALWCVIFTGVALVQFQRKEF